MVITKEIESSLPCFMNHASARVWFKEQLGELFMMQGAEFVEGKKVYYYHLIHKKEVYIENYKKMQKGLPIAEVDFLGSYQNMEITEDGYINIDY